MVCKNCGYPNVILTCPDCGTEYPAVPQLPAPSRKHARFPVLFLCAMFCFGLLLFFLVPTNATSQKHFQVADGVLYFYPEYYNGGPVLEIPESVGGEPVTALSVGCFENNTDLTTVVLPASLQEIRERAFAGCTNLRGIDIPEGVTFIGSGAFRGCSSMEAVYMPGSVWTIGADAFSGCGSLYYLFYNGLYQNLTGLYPQNITPYTWAICIDGEYQYYVD